MKQPTTKTLVMSMITRIKNACVRSRFAKIIPVVALVAAGFVVNAQAQTVRFRSPQTRVTVPLGYNGSYVFTNMCTVSGLVNPVQLSISGLPPGATIYSIAATNNPLPLDGGFASTLTSTNLVVTINFDGTVAQGLYPVSLNGASGAVNNWDFAIQVAKIWNGASYVNPVDATSTNWSNSGNWVSNSVPGANDDVVFAFGATNNLAITNVIVTSSLELASLRFAQTNNNFKTYTIQLNDGVTVGIKGTNGFSLMKDVLNAFSGNGSAGGQSVAFSGIGGTLAVTNPSANFVTLIDASVATPLDFQGLGNLVLDVNQVGIGDYYFFPNYFNWNVNNANGGFPRQFLNSVNLARTNIIKTAYADPYNSTNADSRHFGFSWLNTEIAGSTTAQNFNFGISNIFYVDSINFGGGNSRGNAQFNSIFANSNPIAIFRGTNGGRMSVFAIADGAGTNTSQTSPANTVNLLAGTVDLLTDRLFLGRDRKLIPAGQNPNYAGTLIVGKGVVNANTAVLGYREYEQTNAYPPFNQVSLGYCRGIVIVSNTAVFRVNNSLTLGYTVAANANEESTGGNVDQGNITITGGGQVYANNIIVSGPSYGFSRNNFLYVSNNAALWLTNYCGGANQKLDNLVMANGSQLTLNLSATSTVPVIASTNFVSTGSNTLVIATIRNPGSIVNGLNIPLFKRQSGQSFPSFTTVLNQSGFNGQVLTDGVDPDLQNFQIILGTPKNLLWKGTASSEWNTTENNWYDLSTGLMTNFVTGDNVSFDDSASQFSISISTIGQILPGPMTMTNYTNSYTFNTSGGGTIIGANTLVKYGTNSLQIDAPSSIGVTVNAGQLIGSGSVGAVTVSAGGTMNYAGTINGALNCSGVAVVAGTANGALTVSGTGIATNAGTMNNTFSVASGGLLVNNVGASFASSGSSSVGVGAVMVNRGSINGVNLTIGGTLKDTGEGAIVLSQTLTANSGSLIIPGGDNIGTTTVSGSGVGFPGRILLSQGSTNIFKVNAGTLASTQLRSGYQDYGGSSSVRSQNGCTIVITNVSGTPFASGQSFTMFQYSSGGDPSSTGTSTNTYPVISPATPGPGLVWDMTKLWPNGIIRITTNNAGPTFANSFSIIDGTNIVGQFSWDASYLGYRLQNLVVPNTEGLASTNPWSNISGSWTNLSVTITNVVSTNSVFYRMVFP